jgi:hypothetical protein
MQDKGKKVFAEIVAALVLVIAAWSPANGQVAGRPYTLEMVRTLLHGGVAPLRLQQLVSASCLDFDLDAAAEETLRAAGASAESLGVLRRACRSWPGPAIPAGSATLAYDPSALRLLTLSYDIRVLILHVSTTQTLSRSGNTSGDDLLTYTTRQTGPGLNVEMVLVVDGKTLAPRSYTYTKQERGRLTTLHLARSGSTIESSLQKPGASPLSTSVPLSPNTVLPLTEDLIIQSAELVQGQVMTFVNFDYRSGEPCILTVQVDGEREVRTPAGRFNTVMLRARGCGGEFRLFMRKETPHFLVRQEGGGATVELTSVSQ